MFSISRIYSFGSASISHMQITRAILKTKITISILLCAMLVFWGFQAIGEEWTAEQKEVWKAMETYTGLFKKGDLEIIMASRHDDAIVRWSDRPIAFDKELALFNYRGWFNYDLPVNWELEPLLCY
jgi:type II secretory pathway component PulC